MGGWGGKRGGDQLVIQPKGRAGQQGSAGVAGCAPVRALRKAVGAKGCNVMIKRGGGDTPAVVPKGVGGAAQGGDGLGLAEGKDVGFVGDKAATGEGGRLFGMQTVQQGGQSGATRAIVGWGKEADHTQDQAAADF